MECPRCTYRSPYEVVCCPRCRTAFDAESLEELAHLVYLRDRLDEWREEGLLSAEVADRAVWEIEQEVRELRAALDLRARATSTLTTAALAAPPPASTPAAPTWPAEKARERAQHGAAPAGSAAPAAQAEQTTRTEAVPQLARPAFSWRQVGTYLRPGHNSTR